MELYQEAIQNVVSDYFLRVSDGRALQKILLVGHDSVPKSHWVWQPADTFDELYSSVETACLGGEKGTFIVWSAVIVLIFL